MPPTLFPDLERALPVLWEQVRSLPVREAHRDFIRLCIGPAGGDGVASCLTRHGSWSTILYLGSMTTWTTHRITTTTHRP
ncbi:hypothetical protein [Streptomyces sp. NRRL WC-3742]|uniref:hypothetical protein n=1 Tax=Streptomyces sp. NRRL WC-3742 TaxID=1463934 RepID=UPI00131B6881|nr:hypothetical protein [Streptomyces sp. NRRL WC-3742]